MINTAWFAVSLVMVLGGCQSYDPSPETTYEKDGQYYCEIHDRPLKQVIMPITYGFLGWDFQEWDNRMMYFPNAGSCVEGGCFTEDSSPHWARVWYCGQCRDAEKEYFAAHPRGSAETAFFRDADGKPAGDTMAWTLAQTRADAIKAGLNALRATATIGATEAKRGKALEGYIKGLRKLEEGWAGFEGAVVSMKGKKVRRGTALELEEDQFKSLAIGISSSNSVNDRTLYEQVVPPAQQTAAYQAWVRESVMMPSCFMSREVMGDLISVGKDARGCRIEF